MRVRHCRTGGAARGSCKLSRATVEVRSVHSRGKQPARGGESSHFKIGTGFESWLFVLIFVLKQKHLMTKSVSVSVSVTVGVKRKTKKRKSSDVTEIRSEISDLKDKQRIMNNSTICQLKLYLFINFFVQIT